jgi:hypothetical protein
VPSPWLPVPRIPSFARAGAELLDRAGRGWLSAAVDPVSFEMAQYFWYLDSGLAERELGWLPRDSMTTLADTVRDLGERRAMWYPPKQGARQAGDSEPAG